jgi:hypothetical protein
MARYQRRVILGALRSGALYVTLGAALSACGTQFDSISDLEGLRVMGVQKSAPFAVPGEEVQLRMLYHDTGIRAQGDREGEPRDLSIFWLAGCENPPTDLYALCLQGFREGLGQLDLPQQSFDDLSPAQLTDLLTTANEIGLSFGTGDTFSFEVAEDIISGRPPSADPGWIPYGVNYVFFAACAGELRLDFDGEFPVACYTPDGERARARDFVAGYTAVYSYEQFENHNPRILGVRVDGEELAAEQVCVGADCAPLQPDPERACSAGVPTLQRCEDEETPADCDKLDVRVLVDPDSVEPDGLLSERQGSRVEEQMWANYHTDRGGFAFDLALVNDVATGFNAEPDTEYIAPEIAGPAHVWTVVRDSRGGAEWARFEVCIAD